ncbi:MAG: hypothetical protein Q4A17_01575 [Thermoguttaceae bacterium]|nr:hypothetical protein [Thermoguttaceae bacterium]
MSDKMFKTFVGIGLLVIICLCGFLVFPGNNGHAEERQFSELNRIDQQRQELLEMFKVGLQKSQISGNAARNEGENPEFYYGMVEVAIQQCSQYPDLIADFWQLFEKYLDSNNSISVIARIGSIDLFNQQVDSCLNLCKNIDQYKRLWKTSERIASYREEIIKKEAQNALSLLENAEKNDVGQIVRVLKKQIGDDNMNLMSAYNFLTEYSEELANQDQERFNAIVQSANNQIVSGIDSKIENLKNRFNAIKEKCQKEMIEPVILNSNSNQIEYGVGESHQLLLDIQSFIASELNVELTQALSSAAPDKVVQYQTVSSELMEKTRILNQIIYNLWANRVISNANNVSQFDSMSKISIEYLYPVVSSMYNRKMESILTEIKDPNQISSNVYKMILRDKAPLSAF